MKYSQYIKIKYGKRMITQIIRILLIASMLMSSNEACAFSVDQTIKANRQTWNRGALYKSIPVFKDFHFYKKICVHNNTSIYVRIQSQLISPHEKFCLGTPFEAKVDIGNHKKESEASFNSFINKQWKSSYVIELYNVDRANHDLSLVLDSTFMFISVNIKEIFDGADGRKVIVAEGDKATAKFRITNIIYPLDSSVYQDNKLGELFVLHNKLSNWVTTVLKMPRFNIDYELNNEKAEMWVKINESLANYVTNSDLEIRQFTVGEVASGSVKILDSEIRPEIGFGNYVLSIKGSELKVQEIDKHGDKNTIWSLIGERKYSTLILQKDGNLVLQDVNGSECGLTRIKGNEPHLPDTPVTLMLNGKDGVISLWNSKQEVVWRSRTEDGVRYNFCQ